jgi:ABC-type uncharacterized transport system substrate-binding protein
VVTSTVASDAQLAVFITEADGEAVTGMSDRETAVKHLAAHLALCAHAASTVAGAFAGPQVPASKSFVDRSVSYAAQSGVTVSGQNAADYARTEPGKRYAALARGVARRTVSFPPCV